MAVQRRTAWSPMKAFHAMWIILGLVLLSACSPRAMIVGRMAEVVDAGAVAFERDSDLDLVEASLPATIKLLESLLASNPGDRRLLVLLARLYGSYAFGFVDTRLEAARYGTPPGDALQVDRLRRQARRYHERGVAYALAALEAGYPGATAAFGRVATVASYLDGLPPQAVAPLFWYGYNLGAWVQHSLDDVRALSKAHLARAVMQRVIELDPGFHFGGAHLFMMVYYGSRSAMLGGDPQKARHHYDALKQIAGRDYLLADLLYARVCLPPRQDRQGFVDVLQAIVDHPATEGEAALANAVAVRRARLYLSARDAFFQ